MMEVIRIEGRNLAPLSVGTAVDGRYEILGEIGHGGFAVVYKALDRRSGDEVALKVLGKDLPDAQAEIAIARFNREAEVLGQLNHPNVVATRGFGTLDAGHPYIAMDLLQGCELGEEIALSGAMTPDRVWNLVMPVLGALAEAHSKGIIHKDLKPSNLFLTSCERGEESMVVLDFGAVALSETPDSRLTLCGEMIGTPQYLAPEYILEQEATSAMDVYQMGLVLVEMLTGRHAIQATHPYHIFMCHCRGALDIPEALLESPLGSVLTRALAVEPGDRYADAGELLVAMATIDPADMPDFSSEIASFDDAALDSFQEAPTALMDGVELALATPATALLATRPEKPPEARRTRSGGVWALVSAAAVLLCGLGLTMAVGGALAGEGGAEDDRAVRAKLKTRVAPQARLSKAERARKIADGRAWEALPLQRLESSAHMPDQGTDHLTDGNPVTVWKARGKNARWIEMELGEPAVVAGVMIATGWDMDLDRNKGRQRIQLTFDDGTVQHKLVDIRPGLQTVALDTPVRARHVRVAFPGRRARNLVGLGELQLWGVSMPEAALSSTRR